MTIQDNISVKANELLKNEFDVTFESFDFQPTRKDFEGDITIVVFSLLKKIKGNPVAIGTALGEYLKSEMDEITDFNVVKGFLNLSLSDSFVLDQFYGLDAQKGIEAKGGRIVEYSSPNTNKPLHLGHIRNNLLGYSVAKILEAAGHKVYKTQIINDRGIHICKSMLAWKRFGEGQTPESTGLKGDKLVGNYYVAFDKAYKEEIAQLISEGIDKETAEKTAPILLEAQEMLRKWEAGDKDIVELWKTMNAWVYEGFEVTYKNLGVDFDSYYYESDTYLLGKDFVAEGLKKGVFFKKQDGSVWIDLTEDGLDEKIVLRADGTAVYMTQDIGTAIQRIKDHSDVDGMVYTVGNEQDYHFKVLFLILKKLGFEWANQLYHLSYGMVDLPSGKMKSREGTVVDADDLIVEMSETAQKLSEELGKLEGFNEEQKKELYHTIGLGALKYFILKVDPKKRILFDPKESVDFQGNTGPFIQYTHARIQSILRKVDFDIEHQTDLSSYTLHSKERDLITILNDYPSVLEAAAAQYSPALIANYTYDLVKTFNSFYQNVSILGETDLEIKTFRVQLAKKVAQYIKEAFALLGINVPDRM